MESAKKTFCPPFNWIVEFLSVFQFDRFIFAPKLTAYFMYLNMKLITVPLTSLRFE